MQEEHEIVISHCNNMAQLRQIGQQKPDIITIVSDSIAPVKVLLSDIFGRLKLHDKNFQVFTVASDNDQEGLWSELKKIDDTLEYGIPYRKNSLKDHPNVVAFLSHCCQSRHYSFTIKKCGVSDCSICTPVRMPKDHFDKLTYLPDPVPGQEGHYRSFEDLYGTSTTEEHRPSLKTLKS